MDKEQVERIIDTPPEYDEKKEDAYLSMARDFFDRRMRWVVVITFGHFFFFLLLAVLSGILFFMTEQIRYQIMYAAIFICCVILSYFIKVFAWVMGSGNSIQREIKRLELRIAKLDHPKDPDS